VSHDDEVEKEIAELRRAYRADLPGKMEAIAKAISARDVEGSRTLSHRLRGTAGSYGLTEVSRAAGAIEDALSSATIDWPRVEGALAELTAAASR